MSLENEIHQDKPFKSEGSKLIVNLIYSYNQLKDRIAGVLKEEGLTMQQYNVLRIVNGAGDQGITTSDIRERMLDKMSDASRMVDRLASLGYVVKERDQADRRLLYVVLSEEGKVLVDRLMETAKVDALVAGFDEKKAQQLNELLDSFRAVL
ncbi:MAG: hypothetical protein RL754_1401 [Bacteroidota bacterium]|jgi:DNA-binding MarR family transcriptional regulator